MGSFWTMLWPRLFSLICSFPDSHVRTKAIHWIRHLTNDELCDYLPQLVQVSHIAVVSILHLKIFESTENDGSDNVEYLVGTNVHPVGDAINTQTWSETGTLRNRQFARNLRVAPSDRSHPLKFWANQYFPRYVRYLTAKISSTTWILNPQTFSLSSGSRYFFWGWGENQGQNNFIYWGKIWDWFPTES